MEGLPAAFRHPRGQGIRPDELKSRLASSQELALLDVREQGVHYRGHPFFACSAPLSRLEMMIDDLVPRRDAPVVVLDGGEEDLASKAKARLRELGYTKVKSLDGGCKAWRESGGELFSGVNVPSKAFGEFVEHHYQTPRIPASELHQLISSGKKLVVLDSRPFEEYHRMNIPGGIDVPGAELVWRVHDLAPDPATLVVVNCAGRTRSIIGCQSLRNAGIPNKVVALKDGTMGWDLAGYACERGSSRTASDPSPRAREIARDLAEQVARRFEVGFVSPEALRALQADRSRTLYLLDVRPRDEFEKDRVAGSRHAPGGQLVQAADEYVGVRNARVVLVDPERVRAVMTASWLIQMGWPDVYVLESEAGLPRESGARKPPVLDFTPWASVREPAGTVLDLSTSLRFRRKHIPGAFWVVRSRLVEATSKIDTTGSITLTSEDGVLAHLAAREAQALWPQSTVRVLDGGNAAWKGEWEEGLSRVTSATDDVWYKPYDHGKDYEKHAREYLSWEVALVDQIRRDPTIRFRTYG